jgi:hypothetical protein
MLHPLQLLLSLPEDKDDGLEGVDLEDVQKLRRACPQSMSLWRMKFHCFNRLLLCFVVRPLCLFMLILIYVITLSTVIH